MASESRGLFVQGLPVLLSREQILAALHRECEDARIVLAPHTQIKPQGFNNEHNVAARD
jgi:hypothetical protein